MLPSSVVPGPHTTGGAAGGGEGEGEGSDPNSPPQYVTKLREFASSYHLLSPDFTFLSSPVHEGHDTQSEHDPAVNVHAAPLVHEPPLHSMWTVKAPLLGVPLNACFSNFTELPVFRTTISAMPLPLNCILLTLPVLEVSTPQGEFGSPEQPDGCASVLATKHARPMSQRNIESRFAAIVGGFCFTPVARFRRVGGHLRGGLRVATVFLWLARGPPAAARAAGVVRRNGKRHDIGV